MNICELLENNLNTQLQQVESKNVDKINENDLNNHLNNDEETTTSEASVNIDIYNQINSNQDSTENNSSNNTCDQNEDLNDDEVDYNSGPVVYKPTELNIPDSKNDLSSNDNDNDSDQNNHSNSSNFSNMSNEDETSLTPLEKYFKLCENPTPTNIESASKYVVPALEFSDRQDDFVRVFFFLRKYCFYSDVLLRSLWLEQIQNVIQFLHQQQDNLMDENTDYMLNQLAVLISDLMREPAYQVKKCATASLLYMIERQLLDNNQIEQIIIPCLLSLVKENNEDFHIDCVSLFGKLAPLIGCDLTTKYFLEPFCRLCSSPVFHTRKVKLLNEKNSIVKNLKINNLKKACASNLAEIANVISNEDLEKHLIPHFCEFMKDQVWAIRKVCADLFSTFALRCSRNIRETVLTECFTRLLDDHSRWVKISAYKSLGPFIATFALTESELAELEKKEETTNNKSMNEEEKTTSDTESTNEDQSTKKEGEYSNFMYWRNKLPSLDESLQSSTENNNSNTNDINKSNSTNQQDLTPTLTSLLNSSGNFQSGLYSSQTCLHTSSQQQQQQPQSQSLLIEKLSQELNQEIVPPILLSYFITMIDVNTQNSLDSEMNYNCAYNFPAIALTLGVKYWKFIKNLYKKLAEDLSWKVRQTLAYSIHELAIILGTENTQVDLVPVFDSYIKDVDEVRIGIVSNLTKFLSVLSIEYRRTYMPKLNDFLNMDNQRNWRFRNELGLQITKFCELFPPDCLAEYVQPVTFTLALDKIAEVRITAVKALVEILRQFELTKQHDYRRNFIDDVLRTFANSNKWTFRQLYVVLCENILSTNAYTDFEQFCTDFLPKLLYYRNEKVPNIRVLVARIISTYIINNEFFTSGKSPLLNELELTVQYFGNDPDNDVRSYFPNMKKTSNLPSYDDLYKNKQNESLDNQKNMMDISTGSDSNQIKNTSDDMKMNEDDDDEDDDDDDEDEIIDKTKINQLKIVNLENEIDDEMDEVIESQVDINTNQSNSQLNEIVQNSNISNTNNTNENIDSSSNQEIVLN